jgi:SOS-response transcriptional repressor LexA
MSSSVGAMISNSDLAQAKASGNLKNMIADMAGFTEGTGSYADWVATAKNYGIGNFTEALSAAGYTESQMKNQFEAYRTQQAIKEEQERKEKESSFWDSSLEFLTNISDYTLKLQESFEDFLKDWREYFIEHKVYNNAYNRDSVNKIMQEERESSESAIYALADALTENDVQLLVDPTLQTTALLGQILKVANAILNQQGTGGAGVTLPDTLSGLALGLSS